MASAADDLVEQAHQGRREHRYDDARQLLIEAVALCRESGVPLDLAKAVTALGQIERDLHHGDAALQHYEEALVIYQAKGDGLRVAHTIRHVGDIHLEAGRLDLAEPCYHAALEIYRQDKLTPPLDLANTIRGLAILKFDTGENEQAKLLWKEAGQLYASVNVEAGVAESKRRLALLEQRRDHND